jgi:hypothetical protein
MNGLSVECFRCRFRIQEIAAAYDTRRAFGAPPHRWRNAEGFPDLVRRAHDAICLPVNRRAHTITGGGKSDPGKVCTAVVRERNCEVRTHRRCSTPRRGGSLSDIWGHGTKD